MNPEIYFHFIRETTFKTEEFILKVLKNYKPRLVKENIIGRIETGRPKMRPGLVRLGYEICGGKNWQKIIPICAGLEVLNVSTYTINRIFDEKGGEWPKDKIDNNIIAGMLQRELAGELIGNYLKRFVNSKTISSIQKIFNQTHKITYLGQYIDLNILKIKDSLPEFNRYFNFYKKRSHYFGGSFYQKSLLIGALLARPKQHQLKALSKFGALLGTGLQIVNDVGDFVPSDKKPYQEAFKYYQDQYGDLRQAKLTLPIYLMLKNSNLEDKKFILNLIGDRNITLEEGYELTKLLKTTGAFGQTSKFAKQYVNEAKRQLRVFPKSGIKDLLSTTTSSIKSSAYWKIIKSI